jgi:hypothetical protein
MRTNRTPPGPHGDGAAPPDPNAKTRDRNDLPNGALDLAAAGMQPSPQAMSANTLMNAPTFTLSGPDDEEDE